MGSCKLNDEYKDIRINTHGEVVKDDFVMDANSVEELVLTSKCCEGCNLKIKCTESAKKMGILYKEKEEPKILTVQKAVCLNELNGMENELYSISYKDENLVLFDKKKNKNCMTIYADMIINDEKMGPRVINSLTRQYGFMLDM